MGTKKLIALAIKAFLVFLLFAGDVLLFVFYPLGMLMIVDTWFLIFLTFLFGYDLRDYQVKYNEYRAKNKFWG